MIIDGPWPRGTLIQLIEHSPYNWDSSVNEATLTLWGSEDYQKSSYLFAKIPVMWLGVEAAATPPDFTNLAKSNKIFLLHKNATWFTFISSDVDIESVLEKIV